MQRRSASESHPERSSLLLFAMAPAALHVGSALQSEGWAVDMAADIATCVEKLQTGAFQLLLLEASVTAVDPSAAERLYAAAGVTVVVEVNFGIANAGRVTEHVRVALHRRSLEERQVALAARLKLQNEVSAALTGILLESQLALRQAGPQWAPTLTRLVDLAEHVSALMVAPPASSVDEQTTILHHT